MINPAKLLQMKSAWDTFRNNHPKFVKFIENVGKDKIQDGDVIEIIVKKENGEEIASNLKVTESDLALFESLKGMS